MCGRYVITLPPEAMARLFGVKGRLPNFPPRYNAAPSQQLPVVRRSVKDGTRELVLARWGLVPSWSKGPDARYSMINARAESVAERPAYRGAYRHRRCLVSANGFYEWKKTPGGKQPYYIFLKSGEPFAFAGLWEHWQGTEGNEIESFTIVVTDANTLVTPIHDRMPVVLAAHDHATWLGEGEASTQDFASLLKPFAADQMQAWPVSPKVNSPKNDEPSLLEPIVDPAKRSTENHLL